MERTRHRLPRRTLGLLLLIAAMLLRSLVPAGFMPVLGSDRTVTMAMCGLDQPAPVDVHVPGSSAPGERDQHGKGSGDACPFAAAAMAALLLDAAGPLLTGVTDVAPVVAGVEFDFISAARRAHPPRAPPLRA